MQPAHQEDHLGLPEQLAHQEDHLGLLVQQGHKEYREILAHRGLPESKDFREILAHGGILDHKVPQAQQDKLVLPGNKEHKDRKEYRE